VRATEEAEMAFVQIIEFQTSQADEMKKLGDEWEAKAGDSSSARRRVLCQDRDNPGRHFNIVFFDSYESAMENSKRPETAQFAEQMSKLADGPPTFYNLDVRHDIAQ
jgi:hypothetical protein